MRRLIFGMGIYALIGMGILALIGFGSNVTAEDFISECRALLAHPCVQLALDSGLPTTFDEEQNKFTSDSKSFDEQYEKDETDQDASQYQQPARDHDHSERQMNDSDFDYE